MQDSEIRKQYRGLVYSYEMDRQKLLLAYFFLVTSTIIFLLTLIGAIDGISELVDFFLLDNLGYTNKWSKTYGSPLFVHTVNDIAALAGKVVFLLAIIFVAGYYIIRKENKLLIKYLVVVLGGSFLLLIVKMIFAEDVPYEPIDLLISNISNYPSGHAFTAVVFYLTSAVFLTRKQRRREVRIYTFVFASFIIFLIGISRIFGAQHNISEVLAGWSLGLMWLCLCWLVERYIKIHFKWNV
jgi:membrane-associated phospholipid phosphatase